MKKKVNYKEHSVTKRNVNGFHSTTRRALLVGGITGMFPLTGLCSTHIRHLRFSLLSPFAIFFYASLAGQLFMFVMSVNLLLHYDLSWTNIVSCLNYTASSCVLFSMAYIGRTWPKVMKEVEGIERNLPPFKRNIPLICSAVTAFMQITSLVEQILSNVYHFAVINSCNDMEIDIGRYCFIDNPGIFDFIPYTLWGGILVEIFGIHSVIIWSYNDLLVMVISIYLTEHFVVHKKLLRKATKERHSSYSKLQDQYSHIVRLVTLLSKLFGMCIVLSFFNSIIWICTQLFYTLNKNISGIDVSCDPNESDLQTPTIPHELQHRIYFIYSFGLIVVHLWLVLMLAARVKSTSIAPLSVIYMMPPNKFNTQVDRYIDRIKNNKVALSGLGIFYVTRAMTLTILNAIVTYELVLLKFNNEK